MSVDKLQGLKGLQGLGGLSKAQFDNFIERNRDLISKHGYDPTYINNLYSNKQFIDKYGIEYFKAMPDINMRNAFYKDDIVNTEFKKRYDPKLNKNGFSIDSFNKYSQMSTDAKLALMQSKYQTPMEFEKNWQRDIDTHNKAFNSGKVVISSPTGFSMPTLGGLSNRTETGKKLASDENQRILDKIYNDDVDSAASKFGSQVEDAYYSTGMAAMSDNQVKQAFVQAIKGNRNKGDLGIPEFESHYGNGTDSDITSEMKDFSIDDMRQVLAKRQVYYANMSPEAASTALNNDAKRYIKDHQGSFKRFGLFMKDVGISTLSYTADKVNGIYNLGLAVEDALGDKPVVMVDDKGNVLDPKKTKVLKNKNGGLYYYGSDGQMHSVHQEQINRRTLHNMGKNFDGSENDGILNPVYWTRAEQFGTLDSKEQKQYEKIGSSPYKVAYNPNEDSDLWYEAFKMMSFGIADAGAQLVPYGLGSVGKLLSTAGKVGRVTRAFGKALDTTGKLLTAQTKIGQRIQGTAGALGIAYAYGRGAFQETLQQNLANAEEAALTASQNDIYNLYNSDKNYKAGVDKLINARAASMKAQYIAKLQSEGTTKILDEKPLDKMFHAKAQDAVIGELVQKRVKERMSSREYADLQQKAIDGAGDAAFNSFLTEGLKYGFVNNFGYRKYLYTNPAGLTKKVSSSLKGLTEITTKEGRQRLATEASKFLTRGQKLKQFGKTLGSQAWGGAWTNGTDDMQVDAAEMINNDSYQRYLDAYKNGEALADTYGFADGLYSYLKGLSNSMGQETTWNSALVGGLGSVVNFTPNFANIARLATKEGREAYKNSFTKEVVRGENGIPVKNEDGSIKYKDLKWTNNWMERANYLIQNGVLNTYYGKKQSERDLQSHADYVNNLLDSYNDFKDIEKLVASNIATENLQNPGDAKTLQFVKALHAINTLEKLAVNSKDPTTLSSVVQNAKEFIDKASQLNAEGKENPFSEEEINSLLSQYYATNPGEVHSAYNSQKALYTIAQNAQKLKEASEAYDKAETEVQKIEKNIGESIDPEVRTEMKVQQALNGHWERRKQEMQSEIGDTSVEGLPLDASTAIASVGGVENAKELIKIYDRQKADMEKALAEQREKTAAIGEEYSKTEDDWSNARWRGDSKAVLEANKKLKDIEARLSSSKEQEKYIEDLIEMTDNKRKSLETDFGTMHTKVLTADEIFALDPVTRARMMREENRVLYSREQQREIEKLERRLTIKDGDALQKIQDIGLLTQRIDKNKDAYARMAKNPNAAAYMLEEQRVKAAEAAYQLINKKNAESVVDFISQLEEGVKKYPEVTDDMKDLMVFKTLRSLNYGVLEALDRDNMLPQYKQQVAQAKDWRKTTDDIDAVISLADDEDKDDIWKDNVRNNIDRIASKAGTREELIKQLEKVVDDTDGSKVSKDIEYVLNGLTKLGYQRDATTLENRQKRKQREEDAKKKIEEEKKKVEEAAKAAADKKAAEDGKKEVTDMVPDKDDVPNNSNSVDLSGNTDTKIQSVVSLMDDKTGDTSLTAGDMWYGTADNSKKGKLTVTKTGNKIAFETDGNGETLTITPDEYEATSSTKEHDKDARFEASSMEKRDDGWYFVGNFAGTKDITEVKAKENFNIDNAIKRQQASREAGLATKNGDTSNVDNTNNVNIVVDGDVVKGKSETIEEQTDEATKNGEEAHVSDDNVDSDSVNTTELHNAEENTAILSGNTMSRYEPQALEKDNKIVLKKGKKEGDDMNKYYAWMDAAGIKLQNIIDQELARILQRNPHAKVKFMAIRMDHNATHDIDMQKHLILVLDYDNKINKGITAIHNVSNGGVIESNGKKYLVIGVAGFGNNNVGKRAWYNILWDNGSREKPGSAGIIKTGRKKFFDEHPKERFYVDDNITTEIVPMSLIPGYIVKQGLNDESKGVPRSIIELLADKERNPLGYTLANVKWGIQMLTKFAIQMPIEKVMVPRNRIKNLGRAFALMPAGNGKFVPAYMQVLKYREMRDGALKDKIDKLLTEVTSPDYNTRVNAIIELSKIFYFDTRNGDTILTRKSYPEITLVHDGKAMGEPFALDSSFDRAKFLKAFEDMNLRVNITMRVLNSQDLLKEYAEAGALDTDVALFGTAGSSYSVYAVDREGNMVVSEERPVNVVVDTKDNSDFKDEHRKQVIYNKQYYVKVDGTYYLNGKVVTDEKLIKQLEYNERIVDGGTSPVKSEGVWEYYILGTGDNPEVVKVDRNTKEVKAVPEETAKEIIDKVNKEREMRQREAAAMKALDNEDEDTTADKEADGLGEDNLMMDPETGEMVPREQQEETPAPQITAKQEDVITNDKMDSNKKDMQEESTGDLGSKENKQVTQKFADLMENQSQMMSILRLVRSKWKDAPANLVALEKFLREKNVEVDNIGTSKTDIDAWMKTIEDCR